VARRRSNERYKQHTGFHQGAKSGEVCEDGAAMARVFALVILCAQVSVAFAEGRVGLVNLRFVDVPDQERREWRDVMVRGLEARGLQVISDANLNYVMSTSRELFACFAEDRCRTEIGRRLQADLLLTGQISREKDELTANLSLYAVDLQMTARNQTIHCPGCSPATFRERLSETVNDLISYERGLARATLLVRTRPPGAAIRVDGRAVGTAELEATVVAGPHRLQAIHDNHDPLEVNVDLKAGERLEVDLKLPPRTTRAPAALVTPAPPPKWTMRKIASVSLIAVGGALFLSGIIPLALDGRCATDNCVYFYDTAPAGGALMGIGAALAVAGTVVFLTAPRGAPVRATANGLVVTF
jgi:hypothetical protein